MCECGCGNTEPDWRLPGPDGITYAIQVYPSCSDCGTPAGLIVYRFTAEEARSWGVNDCLELPIHPYMRGSVFGDCRIPIVHPRLLKKKLVELMRNVPEEYDPDGYLEDSFDEAFADAVAETFEEWKRGGELRGKETA
jgi:hypothetical protein